MKGTTILAALALTVTSAMANITFTGFGPYHGQATIAGHENGTFGAGLLNFSDPSNSLGIGTSFNTICVDLDHIIGGGSNWPADGSNSNTLGGGLQSAGNIIAAYFSSIDSDEKAAGLQIAAWEAVYDDGATADFGNGNFMCSSATGGALGWAQTYYDNGRNTPGNCLYITPKPGSYGQAQMTPVPEPASIGVLACGLIAILRGRRRRV